MDSFLLLWLVPITVLIQFYAIGHITYYRWKYERQDKNNRIDIFHLGQGSRRQQGQDQSAQDQSGANTTGWNRRNTIAHNPILYELKHMICIFICFLAVIIFQWFFHNLSRDDYYNVSPFWFYLQDFGAPFGLQIVVPFFFYLYNVDARTYLKHLFVTA